MSDTLNKELKRIALATAPIIPEGFRRDRNLIPTSITGLNKINKSLQQVARLATLHASSVIQFEHETSNGNHEKGTDCED